MGGPFIITSWGCSSVVECPLCMWEDLGSNPSSSRFYFNILKKNYRFSDASLNLATATAEEREEQVENKFTHTLNCQKKDFLTLTGPDVDFLPVGNRHVYFAQIMLLSG